MGDRLTEFENRLTAVEKQVTEMHFMLFDPNEGSLAKLDTKLDTITVFVSGANTVFGLARKHWKRVLMFGAGFMTAAGVGNPKVNAFVTAFFGG